MHTSLADRTETAEPRVRTTRFGSLPIAYDDRVLAPRPWTELQSRWAIELLRVRPTPVLELYAGVGHIGLVAAEATGSRLLQIDSEPVACEYARLNARAAGMASSVEIRCSAIERALGPDERFALVLADPPYLPTDEVDRYPDDPTGAIDGGVDGLEPARRCLRALDPVMTAGGVVLLQLRGARQVEAFCGELPARVEVVEVRSADADRAVVLLRYRGGLDTIADPDE
jgi:methylase of polypeptide subunit release factors